MTCRCGGRFWVGATVMWDGWVREGKVVSVEHGERGCEVRVTCGCRSCNSASVTMSWVMAQRLKIISSQLELFGGQS